MKCLVQHAYSSTFASFFLLSLDPVGAASAGSDTPIVRQIPSLALARKHPRTRHHDMKLKGIHSLPGSLGGTGDLQQQRGTGLDQEPLAADFRCSINLDQHPSDTSW